MNRVKFFNINDLDLSLIKLPEEDCVISKIVAAINMLVERDKMKRLLVIEMNSFLKELGVLSEKIIDGKSATVINNSSGNYGIIGVEVNEGGKTYQKILYTDKGKDFVLEVLSRLASERWYKIYYLRKYSGMHKTWYEDIGKHVEKNKLHLEF